MTHVVARTVTAPDLLGREDERRQLTLLLGHARNGQGGALALLGEPGIGKTALLDDTVSGAVGVRMLRLNGYEAEASIAYAGVQRLAIPLRHHLATLPPRQQDALRVAAGVAEGPAPDRFLVGLGVLGLFTTAAAAEPLVCAVDDAHLLDHESLEVLAFVARRIEVEPVGMLFAARDERGVRERLGGVRDLVVGGLGVEAATSLLTRSLPDPVDPAAATQIAHATGGNPLALIDLAQELSATRLSAVGLSADPVPIGPRLEDHYARRVRAAAPGVQEWVLLAAADSGGDPELIRAAAHRLGLTDGLADELADQLADTAELAGLVELGESVRFRHPLVRSAAYNAATGVDRRRAHRALAEAAGELGRADLEAWHAARATVGTDRAVADRVERAADRAAAQGGYASRASLLQRAAELTPPGPERAGRLVAAAEAALAVGAVQTASAHLDAVEGVTVDPVVRGRVLAVRCSLAMFTVDATLLAHTPRLYAEAAECFHGLDPRREQAALLKAFEIATTTDRRARGITMDELGHRITVGAEVADGPYATVLRGIGALMLLPYEQAVPLARTAFDELRKLPDAELVTMGSAIASLATFLWDDAGRRDLLDQAVVAAREAGALQALDALLWIASLSELWGGTVRRATAYVEQVREVRRAMGYDAENVINASVMAWTGYPRELVHAIAEGAGAVGFGGVEAPAIAALASRDLAEGQYAEAFERLRPLVDEPFLHVAPTYYVDLVEAAVRSDRTGAAVPFVAELERRAAVNGSVWCQGLAARSRALVSPVDEAEVHYRRAVESLAATSARVDLGRAHLVYGEWLRRSRRRGEAGQQLVRACEVLDQAGAAMFLPRATAELEASGVVSGPEPRPRHDLTSQELSIARLAGDGHTNAEIGSLLFISPNTVDYHLRKVFQKLALSSRRQLADRLEALED